MNLHQTSASVCMNCEEFRVFITHQVLVGVGLPCGELEVVPADEQKQEEGQHEKLAVPHRHKEDLRRQDMTVLYIAPHYSTVTQLSNLSRPVPKKQNI